MVDVDAYPTWMDLPGIEGLPVLAFFDAQGRHVLTRSGYREAGDLVVLLNAVAEGLQRDELEPYPEAKPIPLAEFEALDSARAVAELDRLERGLYVLVNSNDGGFASPARHPHPAVLFELQRWGARTARAEAWIEATLDRSLRGHSPRLDGDALADFPHTATQLVELSRGGPALGQSWRDAVDQLPTRDPYRGLQDPVDHGVFRYSAGPGWYHPHFERRAMDNLAWALLLDARGHEQEAEEIQTFVVATFGQGSADTPSPLRSTQQSDPFYYRLTRIEREGAVAPAVGPLLPLEVQARAAQLNPARCQLLERVDVDRWPRAHWTELAEDESSPAAPVDAVGELLIALTGCPAQASRARALAQLVLDRWASPGFVVDGRLIRLAMGVCHAAPTECRQALATVEGLEIDLRFAPPLAELASLQ